MGISLDNVIDKKLTHHLICSICTELVEDALILKTCDHMFCRECVCEWKRGQSIVGNSPTCPECRQAFLDNDLVKPSRIILNMMGEINLTCPNEGCEKIINYNDFSLHLSQCVKLSCKSCGITIVQSDIEEHKKRFLDY